MDPILDHLNAAFSGQYAVERELGRGGMASVWLARDLRHERQVAIKILHPDLAGIAGVDRFLREVRVTARLVHPGIAPIFDSGSFTSSDGVTLPWYAMAYLPGESLRGRLEREGQLPVEDALRLTSEVASALAYAHGEGVIHRDIKPENLLLSGGRTYVADFGLARALMDSGGDRLTRSGISVGTPAYMSPEQSTGDRIDSRTDQYSLATVLYEMLCGEPPFTGANAQAVIARRLSEAPRPIRTVRPAVPEGLERAVLKGLERNVADRYTDVSAFVHAARSTPAGGTARRRSLLFSGLAVMAALVALGFWFNGRSDKTPVKVPHAEVAALFARAIQGYDSRTPAGMSEGIQSLRAAISRDSTYAPAWAALARAYVRAYERSFAVPGVSRDSLPPMALLAANRALAIDSTRADAWLTRGIISKAIDPTNSAPVIRALRRSIAIDSTIPLAWHILALSLAESGNLDEAMDGWRKSVALEPAYTQGLAFLAMAHFWRRQFDSAAFWVDSALVIDPDYVLSRTTAGYIAVERGEYVRAKNAFDAARRMSTDVELVTALSGMALADARAGLRREALATLQRAESLAVAYDPPPVHTAVNMATAYTALNDANRAVAWLRRFTPPGDLHFQFHLRCDPPLSSLQGDPRFQAMLVPSPLSERCR